MKKCPCGGVRCCFCRCRAGCLFNMLCDVMGHLVANVSGEAPLSGGDMGFVGLGLRSKIEMLEASL